jgi:FkbM family methyltransferase
MMLSLLRRVGHRLDHAARQHRWAADGPTRHYLRRPASSGVHALRVRLAGRTVTIHVRGGTMDLELARQILCEDSEYRLPTPIDPRVIVDVGANIGLTSLYFAVMYPEARLFCFEPLPENVELLRMNLQPIAHRVTIVPRGLGEKRGSFKYHPSNDPANFGGGTFHEVGCDRRRTIRLPVTTLADAADEFGIHRIDLMKLDAEGAELATLRGTPPPLIENCQAVIGELHGVDDLDLLRLLEPTHRLGFAKAVERNCYPFVAVRRDEVRSEPLAQAA